MSNPTKPSLIAASVAAPDGVDYIELRKTIRFLADLDLAAFKTLLGIEGEGGGPIQASDIADSTAAGRAVLTAADAPAQLLALGVTDSTGAIRIGAKARLLPITNGFKFQVSTDGSTWQDAGQYVAS
jgi:hypothetical protein